METYDCSPPLLCDKHDFSGTGAGLEDGETLLRFWVCFFLISSQGLTAPCPNLINNASNYGPLTGAGDTRRTSKVSLASDIDCGMH